MVKEATNLKEAACLVDGRQPSNMDQKQPPLPLKAAHTLLLY